MTVALAAFSFLLVLSGRWGCLEKRKAGKWKTGRGSCAEARLQACADASVTLGLSPVWVTHVSVSSGFHDR